MDQMDLESRIGATVEGLRLRHVGVGAVGQVTSKA